MLEEKCLLSLEKCQYPKLKLQKPRRWRQTIAGKSPVNITDKTVSK